MRRDEFEHAVVELLGASGAEQKSELEGHDYLQRRLADLPAEHSVRKIEDELARTILHDQRRIGGAAVDKPETVVLTCKGNLRVDQCVVDFHQHTAAVPGNAEPVRVPPSGVSGFNRYNGAKLAKIVDEPTGTGTTERAVV